MRRDSLVPGWTVTELFEPVAWTGSAGPNLANIPPHQLVTIEPRAMGHHCCILAQSGSGKSYFLGRLLEELLLATKSRLLIIDPNADFLQFYNVVGDSSWSPPHYDPVKRLGRLPTEPDTAGFRDFWQSEAMSFHIATDRPSPPGVPENVSHEEVHVTYGELENSFFSDSRLSYAEAQGLAITHAFAVEVMVAKTAHDVRAKGTSGQSSTYDLDWSDVQPLVGVKPEILRRTLAASIKGKTPLAMVEAAIDAACRLSRHVTPDTWALYDSVLTRYSVNGLLDASVRLGSPQWRVQVLDVTSGGTPEDRSLVIGHILRRSIASARKEWGQALGKPSAKDHRVPTFIVIDEAHHIAPKGECAESAARCRDVVRDIAAEGRKLGLFLVLVSQRPDKLDPLVVGEVGNLALMRVANLQTLNEIVTLFGLEGESPKTLEKSLQLPKGRALLLGSWAKESPIFVMAAMRRTVEGGRDLNSDHWATPPA